MAGEWIVFQAGFWLMANVFLVACAWMLCMGIVRESAFQTEQCGEFRHNFGSRAGRAWFSSRARDLLAGWASHFICLPPFFSSVESGCGLICAVPSNKCFFVSWSQDTRELTRGHWSCVLLCVLGCLRAATGGAGAGSWQGQSWLQSPEDLIILDVTGLHPSLHFRRQTLNLLPGAVQRSFCLRLICSGPPYRMIIFKKVPEEKEKLSPRQASLYPDRMSFPHFAFVPSPIHSFNWYFWESDEHQVWLGGWRQRWIRQGPCVREASYPARDALSVLLGHVRLLL